MRTQEIGGLTAASTVYDIAKRHKQDAKTNHEVQIFNPKKINKMQRLTMKSDLDLTPKK